MKKSGGFSFRSALIQNGFHADMERIRRELEKLQSLKIHVGIMGDAGSDILMIAGVHEYGATIHARKAKHLSIPLTDEAKKAGSPRNIEGLQFIPIAPGYGYLVREKPKAKGKEYNPNNYDWLYMLVDSVEIPERSFIRGSYDNGKNTLDDLCKEAIDGVIRKGWTAEQAADHVGKWALEMTRNYFNTQLAPPKSATTQLTSTQYQPLFDSGRLYNSITYSVEVGQ